MDSSNSSHPIDKTAKSAAHWAGVWEKMTEEYPELFRHLCTVNIHDLVAGTGISISDRDTPIPTAKTRVTLLYRQDMEDQGDTPARLSYYLTDTGFLLRTAGTDRGLVSAEILTMPMLKEAFSIGNCGPEIIKGLQRVLAEKLQKQQSQLDHTGSALTALMEYIESRDHLLNFSPEPRGNNPSLRGLFNSIVGESRNYNIGAYETGKVIETLEFLLREFQGIDMAQLAPDSFTTLQSHYGRSCGTPPNLDWEGVNKTGDWRSLSVDQPLLVVSHEEVWRFDDRTETSLMFLDKNWSLYVLHLNIPSDSGTGNIDGQLVSVGRGTRAIGDCLISGVITREQIVKIYSRINDYLRNPNNALSEQSRRLAERYQIFYGICRWY